MEGRAGGIDTPGILNIKEYLKRTRAATGKLFKGWTTLQAIVERHESVVQKRWMKKTTKWRKEILLTAWPNMAAFHRPDLAIIRMSLANTPATHKWDTVAYKWPYINLEDLVKPNSLPLLLNSRGRNRPGSFAWADFSATHTARILGIVMPTFLDGYTVFLSNSASSDEYCKVVSWDEYPDAYGPYFDKRGFSTGEALLILEL